MPSWKKAMTRTDTKSTVLLEHHLKQLKLPTMQQECEKVAQRCAADNTDHLAYVLQLSELELIEQERKAAERRLKASRFPAAELLDEFDFAARPSVNKPLVQLLSKGSTSTGGRTSYWSVPPEPGSRIWRQRWGWRPALRAERCGSSG